MSTPLCQSSMNTDSDSDSDTIIDSELADSFTGLSVTSFSQYPFKKRQRREILNIFEVIDRISPSVIDVTVQYAVISYQLYEAARHYAPMSHLISVSKPLSKLNSTDRAYTQACAEYLRHKLDPRRRTNAPDPATFHDMFEHFLTGPDEDIFYNLDARVRPPVKRRRESLMEYFGRLQIFLADSFGFLPDRPVETRYLRYTCLVMLHGIGVNHKKELSYAFRLALVKEFPKFTTIADIRFFTVQNLDFVMPKSSW